MTSATVKEVALNAAGIADAFRLAQVADHDGDNRYQELSDFYSGWIGIVEVIAEAAAEMERVRKGAGAKASWGEDLPFSYDAWGAVGRALWTDLPRMSVGEITRESLRRLMYDERLEEEED